jgi:peptidoglycan/xylan/chitin deacetylase (PgdA/CDA1 family)
MKALARRLTARIVERMATARSVARLARTRGLYGLVLNYHLMRADRMRTHLAILQDLFAVQPLSEVVAGARRERPSGKFPIALTFDDGKRSHLTEIIPVLREAALPATLFVTSEPCATGSAHWFDLAHRAKCALEEAVARRSALTGLDTPLRDGDLQGEGVLRRRHRAGRTSWALDVSRLKELDADHRDAIVRRLIAQLGVDPTPVGDDERALSPQEVGAVARHGFTIGSHSATHPILTLESPERVWREVAGSKAQIAEWIGQPVEHFCYPNGNASDTTEAMTRAAGYATAWTTEPLWLSGHANAHRLPRVQIYEHDDRADIALRVVLASLGGVPNPDGTGFAYRRRTGQARATTPNSSDRRRRRAG